LTDIEASLADATAAASACGCNPDEAREDDQQRNRVHEDKCPPERRLLHRVARIDCGENALAILQLQLVG
jgi:hypothetical protein